MSELEADLRQLVRTVIGGTSDRSPDALWAALSKAGVTEVAVARPEDSESGDIGDLAACVAEVAAAGRSAPLLERSLARWIAGDQGGDAARMTVATGAVDVAGGRLHGTATARWAEGSDALVVLTGAAAPVIVQVQDSGVDVVSACDVADEPVAVVTFDGAAFRETDGVSGAAASARLRFVRAAALAGASRAMYEATRAFVRQREQFGAPLLQIPAVASNLAVMKTWLDQPAAALRRAAGVMRSGPDAEADTAALVARILAAQSATSIAQIAHQLHGAIGVTAEFGLQHLSRRVWAWRDADWTERELAADLGRRSAAAGESLYWDSVTA